MKRRVGRRGTGLIDKAINALPFELHLPGGYQYCGPGTRLSKRLARGDPGINPLDEACKQHDIAYNKYRDLDSRHVADRELERRAWDRYNSRGVPFGEKAAAWLVARTMGAKLKLGAGSRRGKRRGKRNALALGQLISHGRQVLRGAGLKKPFNKARLRGVAKTVLAAVRRFRKGHAIKGSVRVLPLSKSGGILPLLPIFAGLSAVGSLLGGASGIVKAVGEAQDARKRLAELSRHNQTMESVALGKQGSGLYVRPYRKGLGLYMKPYTKNC